jgi:glycosyltransferase involved in cell wall biosynthesis
VKVVFVISHPIQYYVPLLQGLSSNAKIDIHVLYTWGKESMIKFDPGFNKVIEWDLPLLDGYNYEFLENVAADPGTHHFKGIDNPSIVNRIIDLKPDKLVLFGWSFKSHLKVLRKFSNKIPIYFRGDSHLLNDSGTIKSSLRRIYLTWLYSHVDYAIAVGTQNRRYYQRMGLKDHQILFAPHAIDDQRFLRNIENDRNAAIAWRNELTIPDEHILFIYVGKFEYRKNLQTLISAKLNLKDHKCSLVLVGNGPDEQELKEMAKVDKNIHFIDFVNQAKIASVYRMADVFVLPSISETWGLGINEAMSCGLAVIASDRVGSAIDLVQQNGFIFRNQDVSDLSDKMMYCVENKLELNNFKAESLKIIKDWSLNTLISKFEQALLSK